MKSKHLPTILTFCLLATLACAGAIKQWATGETLTYTDLNSNFSHIHANMVGGHGARLIDADVNASAAISHSKMATPALLPKAWATITANCAGTPCTETVVASYGVTSISHTGTGTFVITWATARADASYGVTITTNGPNARTCQVQSGGFGTATVTLGCYDLATPTPSDSPFTIIMMDNL